MVLETRKNTGTAKNLGHSLEDVKSAVDCVDKIGICWDRFILEAVSWSDAKNLNLTA